MNLNGFHLCLSVFICGYFLIVAPPWRERRGLLPLQPRRPECRRGMPCVPGTAADRCILSRARLPWPNHAPVDRAGARELASRVSSWAALRVSAGTDVVYKKTL